ncbi:hypothetical protein M1328_02860 [Patescibacteria group bacterium]|nr:hypothetical protein [Patescibacteria group bacterium]
MKKIILTIIVTGLFFLLRSQVALAENFAGNSARFSIGLRINSAEQVELNYKLKESAIKAVLMRYDSPMANNSSSFIETCRKYELDCFLLPSIAGLESTFGRFTYPNSNNPFGWDRGYMMFGSWNQAIDTVGKGLRDGYINKGAENIYAIGPIYSESPTWSLRVSWFRQQFENEYQQELDKFSLLSSDFPVKL